MTDAIKSCFVFHFTQKKIAKKIGGRGAQTLVTEESAVAEW